MAYASLIIVAAACAAVSACPPSTTTTPCPTGSASSTSCATGSACTVTANQCDTSSKNCIDKTATQCPTNQACGSTVYNLCTMTTLGAVSVAQTGLKFCQNVAGAACGAYLTGTASAAQSTASTNTFTTFADCCTTGVATNIKYELIPQSGAPVLACIEGKDDKPYKVTGAANNALPVNCVRWPHTAADAAHVQVTGTVVTSPVSQWTAATFAQCCLGIGSQDTKVRSVATSPNIYGVALERCSQAAA